MHKLRLYVIGVLLMLFSAISIAEGEININTADAQTISEALKGIGPSKAQAIIDYRKEHGPFKSLEEVAQVKGVGEKIIQKNKDKITVGKKE